MSYNRFDAVQSGVQGRAIDPGLQAFMRSVYNTMGLGLLLTGGTAYALSQIPGIKETLYTSGLFYVAAFAPLVFLMFGFTHSRIVRMPASQLMLMFSAFAVTMGVSMGSIFLVYSSADIARAFFVTAGTFAAMSLYGYTTKRDMTGWSGFLSYAVIGLLIASLVSFFFITDPGTSKTFSLIISSVVVLLFAVMIAFETQMIKSMYIEAAQYGDNAINQSAIFGAFALYGSIVTMFQHILNILGLTSGD